MTPNGRPLGSLERRMLVGEQVLGSYNLVGCVHLKERIDVKAAVDALQWVFLKFEMLQYRIDLSGDQDGPRIVRDAQFSDIDVAVIHEPSGLRQPFIDDRYDVESGLWKALIRATESEPTLWLAVSHLLADGHSIALVGIEWLLAYELLRRGETLPEPERVPHADAIEELIAGDRDLAAEGDGLTATFWDYGILVPIDQRSTSRIVTSISDSDFTRFLNVSRSKSASFQASLTALALQALAAVAPDIEYWRVALPYDMRRRLGMIHDLDATGLLVLSDRTVLPAGNSDEARDEIARDLTQRLRRDSLSITPKRSLGADNVFGWETQLIETPSGAAASLNVTHVKVDASHGGRLPDASEFFAFNSLKSGHCQFELKVWTYGRYHTCVLSYPSPLIGDDLARRFADELLDRARRYADA